MRGTFWALCSVMLVSAAQLLLRYAMQALPPVSELYAFVSALWHFSSGTGALLLGLMGVYSLDVALVSGVASHGAQQSVCLAEPQLHSGVGRGHFVARLERTLFLARAGGGRDDYSRRAGDFYATDIPW